MLEPCTVVIFGATGNLAHYKLLPALYHLEAGGHLHPQTRILGFGRRPWSDAQWRAEVQGILAAGIKPTLWSVDGFYEELTGKQLSDQLAAIASAAKV